MMRERSSMAIARRLGQTRHFLGQVFCARGYCLVDLDKAIARPFIGKATALAGLFRALKLLEAFGGFLLGALPAGKCREAAVEG